MKIQSFLSVFVICTMLVACSAKTDESAVASHGAKGDVTKSSEDENLLTPEQMDALRRSRPVAVVFTPAGGSGGDGEVMKELKAINGPLREPNLNYDVFDPQSSLDTKALKQEIESSLDRDRNVLVDNGGTPESRAKAAEIVYEAVGGAIPNAAGTIIRRAPEDKGGGYLLIPIYSKADVQEQMSQGHIPNPEAQSNSVENFFFEPKSTE